MASTEQTVDLQTQLETLFHAVREAEASWRQDDRIDLALGIPGVERHGPIDNAPDWAG